MFRFGVIVPFLTTVSHPARDRSSVARHFPGMHKLSLGLLALLLLPLTACDQPEEPLPTVVDKSAEEAAEITTEVACDYVARCGIIEMSCADCIEGEDCGGCYAEVHEVTPQECADELRPELELGFGCQALTAEEEELVDECLAALPDAECPSVEVVQSGANGGDAEDPPGDLAACDVFEEIMSRCSGYEQSEPGGGSTPDVPPPAEPTPG